MVISNANKSIIKTDVYVHDSVFEGMNYNYENREINMKCDNAYLKKKFFFHFYDVIYFEIQSCEFWCPGPNINDWIIPDQELKLEELQAIQKAHSSDYDCSRLTENTEYWSSYFLLSSGDTILIICKEVDFTWKSI